jgi:hypothetical protein
MGIHKLDEVLINILKNMLDGFKKKNFILFCQGISFSVTFLFREEAIVLFFSGPYLRCETKNNES